MIYTLEDYKITAVKYYLNNDVSLDDVCEICESKLYNYLNFQ